MTQAQPSATAVAANEGDDLVYTVVMNDEEQYSIWPTFRAVPAGWREAGMRGPKADCLAYIETAWTDMRRRTDPNSEKPARPDDSGPKSRRVAQTIPHEDFA